MIAILLPPVSALFAHKAAKGYTLDKGVRVSGLYLREVVDGELGHSVAELGVGTNRVRLDCHSRLPQQTFDFVFTTPALRIRA